jgi:hypothetical protein
LERSAFVVEPGDGSPSTFIGSAPAIFHLRLMARLRPPHGR